MLANLRIKLLDLHFAWHGALVLSGGVEVTGTGTRHEANFITHDSAP